MKNFIKLTLYILFVAGSQQIIHSMEGETIIHEPSSGVTPKMDPKIEAQHRQMTAEHEANIKLIEQTNKNITNTSWNNESVKKVATFNPDTKTTTQGNFNKDGSFDMTITKPKTFADPTTGIKNIVHEPVSRIIQDKNGNITVHTLDTNNSIKNTHEYQSEYNAFEGKEIITPKDKTQTRDQQTKIADVTTNLQTEALNAKTPEQIKTVANQVVNELNPEATQEQRAQVNEMAQKIPKTFGWFARFVESVSNMFNSLFSDKGYESITTVDPTSVTGINLFA